MMLHYKISKQNIDSNDYWTRVVTQIRQYLKDQQLDNSLLVIKLQEITRDDSTMIPKLEYKKE